MALWRQMVIRAKWIKLAVLRPRQNGCHFADNIFKCIFLDENVWISIKISLTFVLKDPINNIPALVEIIAWRRPGDKPLSQPMVVILLTHILGLYALNYLHFYHEWSRYLWNVSHMGFSEADKYLSFDVILKLFFLNGFFPSIRFSIHTVWICHHASVAFYDIHASW